MANRFTTSLGTSGVVTLFVTPLDASLRAFNHDSETWVTYATADAEDYQIFCPETGATGEYGAAVPTAAQALWAYGLFSLGDGEGVVVALQRNPAVLPGYVRVGPVGTAGLTMKALDWNADDKVWSVTAGAYVTYSASDWANYGTSVSQLGSGTGLYYGTVPSGARDAWVRSTFHVSASQDVALATFDNPLATGTVTSVTPVALTYTPGAAATGTRQTARYYAGSAQVVRWTPTAPTAIDPADYTVRIGVVSAGVGTYDTYTVANGKLSVNATTGVIDALPTAAQSAAWSPTEPITAELWELDTPVPVGRAALNLVQSHHP